MRWAWGLLLALALAGAAVAPALAASAPSPQPPLSLAGEGERQTQGQGEGTPATSEQLAALRAILSRSEFVAAEEPGLLDRLLDPIRPWVRWVIQGLLRLILAAVEAGGAALWIGVAVVALAIVGAALAVVRRLLRGALTGDASLGGGRLGGPPRAQDELARARALASSGDARRAVHHHYLAVVLRLDERDHLPFDGALTNRELLPRLDAPSGLADPFSELVSMFDRLWYGQGACTPDEYAAFARLADRVWAAAGSHPPRQVAGGQPRAAGVSSATP